MWLCVPGTCSTAGVVLNVHEYATICVRVHTHIHMYVGIPNTQIHIHTRVYVHHYVDMSLYIYTHTHVDPLRLILDATRAFWIILAMTAYGEGCS